MRFPINCWERIESSLERGFRLQRRVLWVITHCRGWWRADCIAQNISNWPLCMFTPMQSHEAHLSPQKSHLLYLHFLSSFQKYLKIWIKHTHFNLEALAQTLVNLIKCSISKQDVMGLSCSTLRATKLFHINFQFASMQHDFTWICPKRNPIEKIELV